MCSVSVERTFHKSQCKIYKEQAAFLYNQLKQVKKQARVNTKNRVKSITKTLGKLRRGEWCIQAQEEG